MKLCAVGTGFITKSMLEEFQRSEHLNCTSICSRQEAKGLAMVHSCVLPYQPSTPVGEL